MSLEAIQQVTEVEQNLRQRKADAAQEAKRAAAAAEKSGREKLEAARQVADAEARAMMKEAEAEAARRAETVRQQTRVDCDRLTELARTRLEEAAELIVRKVVDG